MYQLPTEMLNKSRYEIWWKSAKPFKFNVRTQLPRRKYFDSCARNVRKIQNFPKKDLFYLFLWIYLLYFSLGCRTVLPLLWFPKSSVIKVLLQSEEVILFIITKVMLINLFFQQITLVGRTEKKANVSLMSIS